MYIDHFVVGIPDKPVLHHTTARQSNLKHGKNDSCQTIYAVICYYCIIYITLEFFPSSVKFYLLQFTC